MLTTGTVYLVGAQLIAPIADDRPGKDIAVPNGRSIGGAPINCAPTETQIIRLLRDLWYLHWGNSRHE